MCVYEREREKSCLLRFEGSNEEQQQKHEIKDNIILFF